MSHHTQQDDVRALQDVCQSMRNYLHRAYESKTNVPSESALLLLNLKQAHRYEDNCFLQILTNRQIYSKVEHTFETRTQFNQKADHLQFPVSNTMLHISSFVILIANDLLFG